MKKNTPIRVPVLDLPGLSAFNQYHGNPPELTIQGSRVVALFDADQVFFDLSERFNSNEPVRVIDFLNIQRQLRARMLELKSREKQLCRD